MSRVLYALALFVLIQIFLPDSLSACGYDFIGDCSTSIGLRINGTQDSFILAVCPFGTVFNGLDLGEIQSLALTKAKGITWESCQNNVTGMALYYRVYPEGQSGGSWQSLDMPQDYFTLVGPYTTRYRSKTANINLTNGLSVGGEYVLEVYLRAEIDTIGDDFIPETFLLQNNSGSNFKLRFEYGGPSAPPFTVVSTKLQNEQCFGDSTGVAGVTVYGNQNGLFYQWSGYNNNFPVLTNLAAGTYTVTVSGQSGYTQSQTITVQQPPAIQNQFYNIVSVDCGGGDGQASAQASGGFAPYQYQWSTGQQGPVTSIPSIGLWQLTVTDAHLCTAVFTVDVPGIPAVEESMYRELCAGQTFGLGGQIFTVTGNYDVLLDGPNACDTLIHLELKMYDAASLLSGLPDTGSISCAEPSLPLCAESDPNANFQWQNENGTVVGNSACIALDAPGNYLVNAYLQESQVGCSASSHVVLNAFFDAPELSFITLNATGSQAADGTIFIHLTGGTAPYTIVSDGFSTTADSVAVLENLAPGDYCFTATSADGCTQTACTTVSFFNSAAMITDARQGRFYPNPARSGQSVMLEWPADLPQQNVAIQISDALGRTAICPGRQVAPQTYQIQIPSSMASGIAILHVRCDGVDGGAYLLLLVDE